MANKIHNEPLFQILKNQFKINLFYKPTMINDDYHYHIILDSMLIIKLVIMGKNFVVIDDITPITSGYIPKVYDTLVECLVNQDIYTVLIERLGNTSVINDACIKANIPVVTDDRFVTIPKKLYNMYARFYKDNPDAYGLYLLAVNSNLEDMPKKEDVYHTQEMIEEEPVIEEVKEEIKEPDVKEEAKISDGTKPIHERLASLLKNDCMVYEMKDKGGNIIGCSIIYKEKIDAEISYRNGNLYIVSCSMVNNNVRVGGLDYMGFLSDLENGTEYWSIYLENVTNYFVHQICKARNYRKVPMMSSRGRGTYEMVKVN